ncbi:hypothetical protein BGZ95_003799 [Linnemannia exigua]|uniref:F-box domain-containing protein n=1 Tax=Linnemannia exigua TaxID=604196 RepID=A0AAD4D3R5_9FUNG|nr:hypothetical protein BGZ95_003799 [Linnemannia exigua]
MASSSGLSTVLNITELTSALARFLTGCDLSRCIQVNKAWFNTFTPHIWESAHVSDHGFRGRPKPTHSRYQLPEEDPDWNLALRRYGHLVRSLAASHPRTLRELGTSVTNLRALDLNYFVVDYNGLFHFNGRWHEFTLGSTAVLCSIFEYNTMTLTTVRITVTLQDDMSALTEALRLVSTLQELVIFDMAPPRTRSHYLDVLVDACAPTTNLRRLVCFQGTVPENAKAVPTLVATHDAQELGTPIRAKVNGAGPESIKGIQELRWSTPCFLEVDDRDRVIKTLRGCGSALQRFQFDAFADVKAEYLFDAIHNSCTNLRQLSFATSNDSQGNKGLWIYLLEICPFLEVLLIRNNIPAELLVDVLECRHASTLQRLHLCIAKRNSDRSVLLRIPEICPRLEDFVCHWPVSTVCLLSQLAPLSEYSAQWACAKTLRRLTLCIGTPYRQRINQHQGTPTRIIWTKTSLREGHASMKYSKKLKCSLNGDENLVAVFE